jgi:hypothetical protein
MPRKIMRKNFDPRETGRTTQGDQILWKMAKLYFNYFFQKINYNYSCEKWPKNKG